MLAPTARCQGVWKSVSVVGSRVVGVVGWLVGWLMVGRCFVFFVGDFLGEIGEIKVEPKLS